MGNEIKRCILLGSAPVEDGAVFDAFDAKNAYRICADGGLDTARKYGILPDLLIGDFDSVQGELPEGIETIRLKPEKDDTDLLAAAREGLRRGCREFILLGALGGERFEHSYANLCVLQFLAREGCRAVMAEKGTRVFLLQAGETQPLLQMCGAMFSAFPFGCPSCTVSYTGMQYPLKEYPLRSDFPLGVSNRIVTETASVTVHTGEMLGVLYQPRADL